jgi:hypothetical protein
MRPATLKGRWNGNSKAYRDKRFWLNVARASPFFLSALLLAVNNSRLTGRARRFVQVIEDPFLV